MSILHFFVTFLKLKLVRIELFFLEKVRTVNTYSMFDKGIHDDSIYKSNAKKIKQLDNEHSQK